MNFLSMFLNHSLTKENYFLCLLPCEKDSRKLYKYLNKVLSFARLPFHTTIYFFSKIAPETKKQIIKWLWDAGKKSVGPILADVEPMKSFKKTREDFVYYLPLKSKRICRLHDKLHNIFWHIHADVFSFLPHLSLFYPKKNWNKKVKRDIQNLLNKITRIKFDKIVLAREKNGEIYYVVVRNL